VLLVDDADQIGDDCAMLPVLTEIAELVDRDRGLLGVATNTASLAVRFRGLDVDLARRRTGILLTPERGDGDLLGARLTDVPPRLPGRALVVARGDVTEVQVFTAPPTVQAEADDSASLLRLTTRQAPPAPRRSPAPWPRLQRAP
jgi:S-DNA-T family DNA segregation ATPase FtsK/SpoIIIE